MENHHFKWENSLQMAIFNSYVKLPEGITKQTLSLGCSPVPTSLFVKTITTFISGHPPNPPGVAQQDVATVMSTPDFAKPWFMKIRGVLLQ